MSDERFWAMGESLVRRTGGTCLVRNCAVAVCFGFLQQRTERVYWDPQGAAGKGIHVGKVDADDFTFQVEDRAAAHAVCTGRVVDDPVAHCIAEMSVRRG